MDIQRFMKGQIWTYEPHADITKQRNPLLARQRLVMILSTKVGLKVVPISTVSGRDIYSVNISTNNKLYALCNQIQTIEYKDLISFYGQINEEKFNQIQTKVCKIIKGEITIKPKPVEVRTVYDEMLTNKFKSNENHIELSDKTVTIKSLYDTFDEDAKDEFLKETIGFLAWKHNISKSTVSRYKKMIKEERGSNSCV